MNSLNRHCLCIAARIFYNQGNNTYGVDKDKPEYWPDSLSWSSFQHPSYAKAQDCNIVLESIFKHLNLDINLYHRDNGSVEPPKKKKKVASKQTVDNDDTVIIGGY